MRLSENIADSFLKQAEVCRELGSPFNSLVCRLLAERLDSNSVFGRRIRAWKGHPTRDALALRAAGGLHALARAGLCSRLSAAYRSEEHTSELQSLMRISYAV